MSADFADRDPLVGDPYPLQAGQPDHSDHWPMVPTTIVSAFVLFLLGSFILFACHRFADTTASHPSVSQRNQYVRPPPPADALCPETVAALPVIRAGSGQGFHCCAVCLAEYEEREMVKLMPVCGHVFHPQCIDAWLLSRGSCPVCRCSDLLGSRTGELRVDVFESEGEGREEEEEEEEEHREDTHRKLGRSRSCNSKVAVQGTGMVFLQRSCSF
ncbi:RING-H2 finger protein ATL57 [Dendrobium catenatum]|uniref:RING-H2 finger protein ATL57 n=1 Tax=Dendrobium catenatum TaxID=906689 RepID=UPI0009F65B4D|nr:RING-H2 finger protein ATL57 [Dendrobium catenatum]